MAHYPQGITLKALLENPDLINPPKNNDGGGVDKKKGESPMVFPGQSAFLGPDIWGRSSPSNDDDDFKFEYMDLEEFLSENGIPMNGELFGSEVTKETLQQQQSSPDPMSGSMSPQRLTTPPLQGSYSPRLSLAIPSTPEGCKSGVMSPGIMSPGVMSPGAMSPGLDVSSPVDMMGSFHTDLQKPVQGLGLGLGSSPPATSGLLAESQEMDQSKPEQLADVDFPVQEQDLLLANPPGKLEFDPRCRSFRTEELRPQPMIKKSRKIFVSEDLKDDKYWARRKKNNIAAKRSRDARRIKENQIALRAGYLEKQNSQLMEEVDKLLQENKTLKNKLAKYEGSN